MDEPLPIMTVTKSIPSIRVTNILSSFFPLKKQTLERRRADALLPPKIGTKWTLNGHNVYTPGDEGRDGRDFEQRSIFYQ